MPEVYVIAGLTIRSAIPLPGVRSCACTNPIDAEIALCEVPSTLGSDARVCGDWQFEGATALLDVPGVARFLVVGGFRIDIAPMSCASPSRIGRELLARVIDVLLLQLGQFTMHGKVIDIEGSRVLLLGHEQRGLDGGAEQLADAPSEPAGIERIAMPTASEQGPRHICFVRPLLPRSAAAEVVQMMPFSAFSAARGLARCGDLLAVTVREGDFLRAAAATFAGASLCELHWPMRTMSASEIARIRGQIVAAQPPDLGVEVRP